MNCHLYLLGEENQFSLKESHWVYQLCQDRIYVQECLTSVQFLTQISLHVPEELALHVRGDQIK